ncbi:hypothetical protein [Streptomyces sp. S465]|uniref:hypothetical protein n=1 Tax=Streptomyces sp. S465 TaxID=2979468 RepID=UPI0022A8C503|nr:hypothetical protein [Streptomyces sp. S465]WAP61111.1 hypothetical protein N6H00_01220 [Streptomyces sp. S465]
MLPRCCKCCNTIVATLPVTTFPLARSQDAFHAVGQGEGSVKILINPHHNGS